MSSFVLKWITNRFLKDNQLTRFGVEDPYYEQVFLGTSGDGKKKYTKVARKIPEGISENDTKVLMSVKKQAYRYDMWITLLGVRLGLSNLVGFIPIVGPIITNFWSIKIYFNARALDDGLPLDIQFIFFFNILVDFFLSFIPIVGDIVEIGYKANSRNFLLLEKHLERVGQRNMGVIPPDEVRPGFLNDKVQPYVDETIKPGAVKAGQQIKKFVNNNLRPNSAGSASVLSDATTSSSDATATGTLDTSVDDDSKSIRSFAEKRG